MIVLFLLSAAAVAAAPWLANTGPVRAWAAKRLEHSLGRGAVIGSIEAGWGSGVVLRGVRVANPRPEFSDPDFLTIDAVHMDQPLLQILFGDAGRRIVVEGPTLNLEQQAGGRTNVDDLVRLLAPPRPPKRPEVVPERRELSLRGARVRLTVVPPRRPRAEAGSLLEDPVVLPADAGAHHIELSELDLDVVAGEET
ncbi:MAG: hypothetical protein ACE5JG_09255, partial [Planctomycetota bacterium]